MNTFALFLRFFILLFRLNIYDTPWRFLRFLLYLRRRLWRRRIF
jgi:hypothetical protein